MTGIKPAHQKKRLLIVLSILLLTGFLSTSLTGYFVSISAMREHIISTALPLTGDTVYSEIQRDLLQPVFISSVMANDTFLKDWIISGEEEEDRIAAYLNEIKEKYQTYSTFLVSESTRRYYYGKGLLKTVAEDEPRDVWYFRVRDMPSEFEINVDFDMANSDALTVFVNHKVLDNDGRYLGATGVGLTLNSIVNLLERYGQKYQRGIYFVDPDGEVLLRSSAVSPGVANVRGMEGMENVADRLLNGSETSFTIRRNGDLVYVNTRFIPELNWHLVVEQAESPMTARLYDTLLRNIGLCTAISLIILGMTYITIDRYQQRIDRMFATERVLRQESELQQAEISRKHHDLEEKNRALEEALGQVKTLEGLLPICASCKCIRREEGYWEQVEIYLTEHTLAEFTHGICPECSEKLYPEYKTPPKPDS